MALAKVLLADDDLTSRLTLQTVLRAGGYWVDVAATDAEAIEKLDQAKYDLVLSDLRMESEDSGLKVLAHAKMKEYKPATALVTSQRDETPLTPVRPTELVVETEGVAGLLSKVADLLGARATKRVARALRQAALQTTA